MKKFSFLSSLCVLSILSGSAAFAAKTSITVTSEYKKKITATADDCDDLKPKNFDSSEGDDPDSYDVCYTGKAADVEDILEKIAKHTDHWQVKDFETYKAYRGDGEWAKAKFVNKSKNKDVGVIVHPCR